MNCFLLGILGGCLVEFMTLYKLRTKKNWPEYYKTYRYWILGIAMILFGGLLSWAFNPNTVLANLYIGASAPSLINKIIGGKYK